MVSLVSCKLRIFCSIYGIICILLRAFLIGNFLNEETDFRLYLDHPIANNYFPY